MKNRLLASTTLADEQRDKVALGKDSEVIGEYTPIHQDYLVMMNIDEVSALVRMSARTIRRLVYDGTFPEAERLSPGRQLWHKSEVLEFLGGCRNWPAF